MKKSKSNSRNEKVVIDGEEIKVGVRGKEFTYKNISIYHLSILNWSVDTFIEEYIEKGWEDNLDDICKAYRSVLEEIRKIEIEHDDSYLNHSIKKGKI